MQRELVERAIEGDREAFTQLVDGNVGVHMMVPKSIFKK